MEDAAQGLCEKPSCMLAPFQTSWGIFFFFFPPEELCRGLQWWALHLRLGVLVFKFCGSLDPDLDSKAGFIRSGESKTASDSHTFKCLSPCPLAVSGPTCNHCPGANAGKGKDLSKHGRGGGRPAWAWAKAQGLWCGQATVHPTRQALPTPGRQARAHTAGACKSSWVSCRVGLAGSLLPMLPWGCEVENSQGGGKQQYVGKNPINACLTVTSCAPFLFERYLGDNILLL